MNIIIINLIIIGILLLIDVKPIKVIIDYILIVINLAILIIYNKTNIELSYISMILIIVYGSALAILFAIIIMLFTNIEFNKYNTKEYNI
jgi:hypothetical protein